MTDLQEWMAKAAAFEILSLSLLRPTEELASALSTGEFAQACVEVFGGMGADANSGLAGVGALEDYAGRSVDDVLHEVRRDWTRIFVGAVNPLVTPYVGVWAAETSGRHGILCVGKDSLEIERFMRRCGVAKNVSLGQVNDPVDHIGTVCEFMKYLCLIEARAVAPAEGFDVRPSDFGEFHGGYFRGYAEWCAGRIRESRPSPFYAFVAEALERAAQI